MSIADKLTYLNTTKQLLKTEINKINNVLTDNSTFRSYPQELFNGYIDILNNGTDTLWNNLEKVSQTGTEAVLEGVETAPMKMVLNGNTSQETTTGKNLFNKDNEQKVVINPTSGTERYGIIIEAPNKKVSFSGTWLSDNNLAYKLINGETYGSYVSFNSPITIDVQDKILFYNGTENQKLSAIVDKIQIEIGTITSYEPYTGGQPSPSPDYPQEVKVVKGENVVSVQGKNLLDMSYLVKANADDKTYAGQGFWAFKLSDKIGTYTLSRANANMVSGGSYIAWGEGNDITTAYNRKTWIAHQSQPTLNNKKQTKTNSGELWLFLSTNETKIQNIPNDYGYLMLELGSTATDFVPYSKTDYPINLASKNLFSTENLVNATITDTGEYLTGDNRCTGDYVFLDKSQENLALSFNLNILFMGIAFYDENKQYLSRATINNINLLTTPIPANADYCRAFFQFTTSPAAKIDAKIVQLLGTQLEYGTERTNYVSYFTPIELCKINTYKDFPFKAINGNEYYDTLTDEQKNALNYGSWYVHKAIKKVVLDGTNNLFANKTGNAGDVYATSNITDILPTNSNNISILAITNHFKVYPYASLNNIDVGFAAYERVNILRFKFGTNSSITTLELANQWLSNNNVTLYYVLATPTETEITNSTLIEQLEAIYKAKSVKDKTYITQTNDDLPFILDVEAIKEYSAE